jgi:uncharacterized RDD family membrane protein YckC
MMKDKHTEYVELASIGSRFVAIVIDGFILGLITGILFGTGGEVGGGIGVLSTVVYHWFFLTRWDGQTPGKRAMGIRVVHETEKPLSDVDAMIRAVGYYVSGFVMGLGYIWALIDDEKRAWHDMLAKTLVVKA